MNRQIKIRICRFLPFCKIKIVIVAQNVSAAAVSCVKSVILPSSGSLILKETQSTVLWQKASRTAASNLLCKVLTFHFLWERPLLVVIFNS